MTPTLTVVGSGASGAHVALSVLEAGGSVRMLDVGFQPRHPVYPGKGLDDLKAELDDPVEYFLGKDFGAALLPGTTDEYYGIPPSKNYVFEQPDGFALREKGFAALFSFARGGLAEAWTGGCYPLLAGETVDFPFPHEELAEQYDVVAKRIGVSGAIDDLVRFMPKHAHLQPPLQLDSHSQQLLDLYGRKRTALNRDGVYVGRSRLATLSQPHGVREACQYTGRCLWGCPHRSLYTPSTTIQECLRYDTFEYVTGVDVSHLELAAGPRVRAVVGRDLATGAPRTFEADRVALAAGALTSARIVLSSMYHATGERVRLRGLMDNRQVLVPFLNLGMIGRSFSSRTYQYHQVGMGIDGDSPREYVHGQITTLKTALVHPLLQRFPLDLGSAARAFRVIHPALGLVNVNFRDTRRDDCYVELSQDGTLDVHYQPDAGEPARVSRGVQQVKRALLRLGCVVPPGMMHVRPMGASVHYAGLLPMTGTNAPLSATPSGESRDIRNLFLADGVTLPFLPAKNLTFTLMANAARIGSQMLR